MDSAELLKVSATKSFEFSVFVSVKFLMGEVSVPDCICGLMLLFFGNLMLLLE